MWQSSGSQFFRTPIGRCPWQIKIHYGLLTILGVTEILCSFKFVVEGKTGQKIRESSRLEFWEKFSANNFALSDAEENTSRLLNRGGIADLPLLRTPLTICKKPWGPSFWEVMESFVLLAYASLAALRILLQWLLDCLNFTLDSEDINNELKTSY